MVTQDMFSVSVVMVLAEYERVVTLDRGAVLTVAVVVVVEYTNTEMENLIDEHIHSERNRKILKRRMIDGVCFEPLAEEFGLSVAQIKRIVYNEQERIFKFL